MLLVGVVNNLFKTALSKNKILWKGWTHLRSIPIRVFGGHRDFLRWCLFHWMCGQYMYNTHSTRAFVFHSISSSTSINIYYILKSLKQLELDQQESGVKYTRCMDLVITNKYVSSKHMYNDLTDRMTGGRLWHVKALQHARHAALLITAMILVHNIHPLQGWRSIIWQLVSISTFLVTKYAVY